MRGEYQADTLMIDPKGYVRRTRADAWKGRPVVLKYYVYKDAIRNKFECVGDGSAYSMHFVIKMPKSWSKKKRDLMRLAPHQQKPDIDNLVKAVLDSMMVEDKQVYKITADKHWGDAGSVTVRKLMVSNDND